MSQIYYGAQVDNKLKAMVFQQPIVRKIRGVDIKFSDRKCVSKIFRIIYKCFRCLFMSYIFYLVPFTTILISFSIGYPYDFTGPR